MMTIIIHGTNEEKGIEQAMELLKANGFNVETRDALCAFLDEEAAFRLDNGISLDSEQQRIYDNLSDEDKYNISQELSSIYLEKDIFDYDYMDTLASDCFNLNIKEMGIEINDVSDDI